jgi:hypothetical protein
MTVSGLGFWTPGPSYPFTVSVGLWKYNDNYQDGPLIGSVSTATETSYAVATSNGYGQWNFMSINATLQPGDYIVGASGYDLPHAYNWDPVNDLLPISDYIQLASGMTFVRYLQDDVDTGLSMPWEDCLGGGGCPVGAFGGNIEFAAVSNTPLPATLPLLATALGGLGLLGWRRKRKAQTIAA